MIKMKKCLLKAVAVLSATSMIFTVFSTVSFAKETEDADVTVVEETIQVEEGTNDKETFTDDSNREEENECNSEYVSETDGAFSEDKESEEDNEKQNGEDIQDGDGVEVKSSEEEIFENDSNIENSSETEAEDLSDLDEKNVIEGELYSDDGSVLINEKNFPDEAFRQYVYDNFDKGADWKLNERELKEVTVIDCDGTDIKSLYGIGFFENLDTLNCINNDINWDPMGNIDVTVYNNTKLRVLHSKGFPNDRSLERYPLLEVYDCPKSSPKDISNNPCLKELCISTPPEIYGNQKDLTKLEIYDTRSIKNIDLSNYKKLERLVLIGSGGAGYDGYYNDGLTTLDLSHNSELKYLDCSKNYIAELDLCNNSKLEYINCSGNQLSSLDGLVCLENLSYLNCSGSGSYYYHKGAIAEINLSNCNSLEYLDCSSNMLTALDLSNNTHLKYLDCKYNNLTDLIMKDLTELEELYSDYNYGLNYDLTNFISLKTATLSAASVKFGQNTKLETLGIGNRKDYDNYVDSDDYLSKLDLSKLTALTDLTIDFSSSLSVDRLDCSANSKLKKFYIYSGTVTDYVDLSKNTELEDVYFYYVFVNSIKLGDKPSLSSLRCYLPDLVKLNISGCPIIIENMKNSPNGPDIYDSSIIHYTNYNLSNAPFLTIGVNTQLVTEPEPETEDPGWHTTDKGLYYYCNDSGERVSGWNKINNQWYYFNEDGIMQTGWRKINNAWYYLNESGSMKTGWLKYNSKWYYLGDSGSMQTGWVNTGGFWFYFNTSGVMQTGWLKIGSSWYHLMESGAMSTGWEKINGTWYFFKTNGVMAENEWYDGYWLNSGGKWTYPYKASWKKNSKGWWFGDESGWYAKSTKIKINDKYYSFDKNGYLI